MKRWYWPAIAIGVVVLIATEFLFRSSTSKFAESSAPSQIQAAAPKPLATEATPKSPSQAAVSKEFGEHIVPFLSKHCFQCHGATKQIAGLNFAKYRTDADARKDRSTWEKILEQVRTRQMPPSNKPQPDMKQTERFLTWIENELTKVDCGRTYDPGRVTVRRLNRAEYNNTIRDLLGVNLTPADDFPSDDVGYGFDHIGDVLSMPPILMEKYLAAADKVLAAAIVDEPKGPITPEKIRINPQQIQIALHGAKDRAAKRIYFFTNAEAFVNFYFKNDGDYQIRIRAYGEQAGNELPKMVLRIDNKDVKTFAVAATEAKPEIYEAKVHVGHGQKRLAVAFVNDFYDEKATAPKNKDRNLALLSIEVEGPFNAKPKPLPESHVRIMIAKPTAATPAARAEAARKIAAEFARRAYRRPVQPSEVDRLVALFRFADAQGESFESAVRWMLKGVLVSPNFLFRVEPDEGLPAPDGIRTVNDFEFASRLSYFLWSSMPDEELFRLAENRTLRKPEVLRAQVQRMLKDPKARALTENFAGQWLQLRQLRTFQPDRKQFKEWDDALRDAMIRETELFFESIVREDRSVLEFLDAKYTFVNDKLAKLYGLNVKTPEFQKVYFTDDRRAGIITHASILALTSNPTRTSPVKRGKFVLENILGTPPPPPPPEVPELEDAKRPLTGTLRQKMEQHRTNPTCASCHQRMDPIGFGMENFNAIGAWRTHEGKFPIDASGVLPDGSKFSGPADLRAILRKKANLFRKCLAEKMLTYALGRGLEYYDRCAVDEITKKLTQNGDRFSALILAIVESDPFQKRHTQRSE